MRGAFLALTALFLAACVTVPAPEAESTKRIALTFDDIPRHPGAFFSEDERTRRMLEQLDEAGNVQAAFFLNPGKIAERPGAEKRISRYVAAGHVIANHTSTHHQLSDTDVPTYLADIDAAETWLKGRDGYRPWFRFPYLDEGRRNKVKRDAIRAGLADRGLANGYVTVDASDWFYEQAVTDAITAGREIDMDALRDLYVESHVQSAEFTDGLARKALGRSPAHVMLLHETDLSALYLGDLVAGLKAEGWTIISADQAFADPISQLQPDVPSAQGTLIEALAWEQGFPAPRWYERNNTDLAGKLFRQRVLGLEE